MQPIINKQKPDPSWVRVRLKPFLSSLPELFYPKIRIGELLLQDEKEGGVYRWVISQEHSWNNNFFISSKIRTCAYAICFLCKHWHSAVGMFSPWSNSNVIFNWRVDVYFSRRELPTCLGPALSSIGTWEQQSCSYLELDSNCCGSWDAWAGWSPGVNSEGI